MRINLLFLVLFALSGCGGGSSGSSAGTAGVVADDGNGAVGSGDGAGGSVQAPTPGTSEGTIGNTAAGSASVDSQPPGMANPVSADSAPMVVFADAGPAPGIPGGFIENFRVVEIGNNDLMAASGTVRGSFVGNVAWFGPAQAPEVLYRTGDSLTGDSADGTFASVVSGAMSSDGALALVVATQADTRVLVLIEAGARTVLLREGDMTEGPYDDSLDGASPIVRLLGVRHSNAGLAVLIELAKPIGRPDAPRLWLELGENGFSQMMRSYTSNYGGGVDSLGPSVLLESNPGCRLYSATGDVHSGENALLIMADTGDILVDAWLSCESAGSDTTQVVARRSLDGSWKVLTQTGGTVPGAPDALFTSVGLRSVSDSTALAVIRAGLDIATGGPEVVEVLPGVFDEIEPVLQKESFWAYPMQGSPRLVSVQDETVQAGDQEIALGATRSSGSVTRVDQRNDIVVLSLVGARSDAMILRGPPHVTTQPHATLAAPGAASLSLIAAVDSNGLPGLPEGVRFTQLSAAELDVAGNTWFVALSSGSQAGTVDERALWRADANAQLTKILSESDEVSIAGIPRELGDILLNINRGAGSLLQATDSGEVYFITRLRDSARESQALVRLPGGFNQ